MNLFTLDGRTLESFGLVPNPGHANPAFPAAQDRLLSIPGRVGLYDFGAQISERRFSFPLTFAYEADRSTLQTSIRAFISFLHDSKGSPRTMELRLSYDADRRYLVRSSGPIDMQRIFQIGQFTLNLIAADPFAYAAEHIYETTMTASPFPFSIDSDGNLRTEPVIVLTNTGLTTVHGFSIVNEYQLE